MALKHATVEVVALPCPCCGSSDLDIGVQSCMEYGVKCRGLSAEFVALDSRQVAEGAVETQQKR